MFDLFIAGLYGTFCPQMMWAHSVTYLGPFNPIHGIKHMICLGLCGMGQLKADTRAKYNLEVFYIKFISICIVHPQNRQINLSNI